MRLTATCALKAGQTNGHQVHGVWKAVYFSPALADWGRMEAADEPACARLGYGTRRCNECQLAAGTTDARQAEQQKNGEEEQQKRGQEEMCVWRTLQAYHGPALRSGAGTLDIALKRHRARSKSSNLRALDEGITGENEACPNGWGCGSFICWRAGQALSFWRLERWPTRRPCVIRHVVGWVSRLGCDGRNTRNESSE